MLKVYLDEWSMANTLIPHFDKFEDAWLNLDDSVYDLDLSGPLFNGIFESADDTIPLRLLKVLRNPKYFSFTCKHILNIEISPMQAAVLQELWYRPFPMLIASRGFSKTFLL